MIVMVKVKWSCLMTLFALQHLPQDYQVFLLLLPRLCVPDNSCLLRYIPLSIYSGRQLHGNNFSANFKLVPSTKIGIIGTHVICKMPCFQFIGTHTKKVFVEYWPVLYWSCSFRLGKKEYLRLYSHL